MKFRPLHDRVVVKRIDAEDKTAGASSFRTVPRKSPPGEITASARWPRRSWQADPIDLKVGDRVLFGKWSGTESSSMARNC